MGTDRCDEIMFSNRDENGFELASAESEEKIRFECFVDSYNTFVQGGEDYSEELKQMEIRLLEREGVDTREMNEQKKRAHWNTSPAGRRT